MHAHAMSVYMHTVPHARAHARAHAHAYPSLPLWTDLYVAHVALASIVAIANERAGPTKAGPERARSVRDGALSLLDDQCTLAMISLCTTRGSL